MKDLRIAFGLVVVAGLMAATATSAMASARWSTCKEVAKGTGQWSSSQCNSTWGGLNWEAKELTETEEVTSSFKELESVETDFFLSETSRVRCNGTIIGWVGSNGQGGISGFRNVTCNIISGPCEVNGLSELWRNLPWGTQLREETDGEIRDLITAGGEGPGLSLECLVLKASRGDTCFGKTSTLMGSNRFDGTVAADFEERSEKSTCTTGGTGEFIGADIVQPSNGRALQVGRPTAPGAWVQCEEVEKGKGHWLSDLCNSASGELNWETKEVLETEEVTSSFSGMDFTDTVEKNTIRCSGTDAGWVGSNGRDEVSTITATKCEEVSGSLCETSKPITIKLLDLPWEGTLIEESNGEIGDITRASGSGPGYDVECDVAKILKIADECHVASMIGAINNQANGTVKEIFETYPEEKGKCSSSGAASGEVSGTEVLAQRSGHSTKVGKQ